MFAICLAEIMESPLMFTRLHPYISWRLTGLHYLVTGLLSSL